MKKDTVSSKWTLVDHQVLLKSIWSTSSCQLCVSWTWAVKCAQNLFRLSPKLILENIEVNFDNQTPCCRAVFCICFKQMVNSCWHHFRYHQSQHRQHEFLLSEFSNRKSTSDAKSAWDDQAQLNLTSTSACENTRNSSWLCPSTKQCTNVGLITWHSSYAWARAGGYHW